MKRRNSLRITGIICLLLYALSAYFFITREKTGNYTRMVSYEELYAPSFNTTATLKKWQHIDQFPEEEIKKGKELTRLYAGIRENDPSLTKMLKIGSWLQRSYRQCKRGEPTEKFSALSLTDQYTAASRAESPVWCGTFGIHFLFFCSINGITSRAIEKKGGGDHHVMNESFIPELGQWVFSDLLFNTLYCRNEQGRILNLVDSSAVTIYGQQPVDSFSLVTRQSQEHWQRYLNKESLLNFYYRSDLQKIYAPREKLTRYAFPVAWYETFTLTPISNTQFYLRILSLYLGLVMTVIFVLLYLKRND
jgi:hypothetical protein